MNFGDLPEGCIAKVISLTTPVDTCRLSVVSPAFRLAADSDIVWNEFLSSDHMSTVSRSGDDPPDLMSLPSKKQLFLSLSDNPILIDDGIKSFWLKCYMIAARDLVIVWGGTPSYWSWISVPDSRFNEVAQLRKVWWLEIRGKINTSRQSPATTYIARLVFKIGWDARDLGLFPIEVSVGVVGDTMNKSGRSLASFNSRPIVSHWYNDYILRLRTRIEMIQVAMQTKTWAYNFLVHGVFKFGVEGCQKSI